VIFLPHVHFCFFFSFIHLFSQYKPNRK
jgi:hypothetical protein